MTEEKQKRKPLTLQTTVPVPSSEEDSGGDKIRQSLSHGRSKSVIVEVKRKRSKVPSETLTTHSEEIHPKLTDQEQSLRLKALREAEAVAAMRKEERVSIEVPLTPEVLEELVDLTSSEKKEAVEKREARLEGRRRKEDRDDFEEEVRAKPAAKGGGRKKAVRSIMMVDTDGDESSPRFVVGLKKLRKGKRPVSASAVGPKLIEIRESLTVSNLSVLLGKKTSIIIKGLSKYDDRNLSPSSIIEGDAAQLVAEELGYSVTRHYGEDKEAMVWDQTPVHLKERPPVVTVMGHVDHGKTSLLDALRKTDIAAKEVGGITQHIGAYQVTLPSGKTITFVDTPGHEAFTQMRARGAQTTDMVILVVAADDGIKEQTIEAIRHAQAAKVPIIVAINKIDKPGARPDHVRQALLSYDIVVESLGGDVQAIEVSALTGLNLDALEEAILLQGEIMGLQADEDMRAKGIILETHMKKGQGVVATLLMQEGTLSKGDIFVVGTSWGRVRLLFDDKGKTVQAAKPSQPVEVVGFSDNPSPGDRLMVVPSEAKAREIIQWKKEKIASQEEDNSLIPRNLTAQLKQQQVKELPVIIKADAQGSQEGLEHELLKIQHEEVAIQIIYKGVGSITESDALLAQTTGAVILGFNVGTLPEARRIIETKGIQVLNHRIIYQAIDEIRNALSGLLEAVYQEETLGKAEVIQVFMVKKMLPVAGSMVKEGLFRRGAYARVIRDGKIIFQGIIRSLRHIKEDVKEIASGYECGISLEGYSDFKIGDTLECFTKKEIQRSV
jgi:translation initiation factor IF-2